MNRREFLKLNPFMHGHPEVEVMAANLATSRDYLSGCYERMGVTVFWTPTGSKSRGFKMGPIASTGMLTCSGTISKYTAGGPFSIGKDVANLLNANIPDPDLTNVQDVRDLIDFVKEQLNPWPQY